MPCADGERFPLRRTPQLDWKVLYADSVSKGQRTPTVLWISGRQLFFDCAKVSSNPPGKRFQDDFRLVVEAANSYARENK